MRVEVVENLSAGFRVSGLLGAFVNVGFRLWKVLIKLCPI